MRRKTVIATIAALALGLGAQPAFAQGEEHNCAGVFVSAAASTFGPVFGEAVTGLAHAQAVDNFGIANCGEPPRQNP
jgi:hypothetical protein